MSNPTSITAERDDALADHDAVGLADLIATGEISASEAVGAAIERAAMVEPSINAIVTDCFDQALEQAKHAPAGRLGGVPTFIKDMTAVAGMPTRFGTDSMRNAGVDKATAPTAQQFAAMGTICLGKSSLPEFGFVCTTEFPDSEPTRNPWNLHHTVGGSSGGSAALVAAGVVPIGHAADGGGSIRIPASAAGLVGLKATRGRMISDSPTRFVPVDLVAYGAVTRTVRDTCVYLHEAEKLHLHKDLPPVGLVDAPLDRRLRIGLVSDTPTSAVVDAANLRVLGETGELLESLGHEVTPIESPASTQLADDFALYWAFLALAVKVGGKRLLSREFDASQLTPLTKGLAADAKRHLARLPGAIRRLRRSGALHEELFTTLDVILSPTVGQLPPPIGHIDMALPFDDVFPKVKEWACFTPLANATGAPSLSLPMGHDPATNLPVGMLFGAAHGQDRLLLELALQLEEAQPFRRIASA